MWHRKLLFVLLPPCRCKHYSRNHDDDDNDADDDDDTVRTVNL